MEQIRLGNIYGATGGSFAGMVYSSNGLSPSLTTMDGGGREPHIVEIGHILYDDYNSKVPIDQNCLGTLTQQYGNLALRTGEKIIEYVAIDDSYKNRDERIYKETSPTLRSERESVKIAEICVMRGREEGQQLEMNGSVCSNTITTVQKDNLVLELDNDKICPTLNVLEDWTWEIDGQRYLIRIRKLTPRECWRLMSFSDDDFDKAQAVNSSSQLYKQAGNSIVEDVLCAIFREMIPENDFMNQPEVNENA